MALRALLLRGLTCSCVLIAGVACTPQNPSTGTAAPHTEVSERATGSPEKEIPARGKAVLVDIPGFELIALQDGVPVFRSRVIVGRPGTPTPELTSTLYAIRFNPAWSPTPSMIRNEGAHYIPPGPQNPLGRILFELDNDQLIYLHDTNERNLFNQAERALSHGCIRVEQARQLASWALGISLAAVDGMVSRGATFSVPLPESIPVSLVSYASLHDGNRKALSYADIHRGEPKAVAQAREIGSQTPGCPAAAAP